MFVVDTKQLSRYALNPISRFVIFGYFNRSFQFHLLPSNNISVSFLSIPTHPPPFREFLSINLLIFRQAIDPLPVCSGLAFPRYPITNPQNRLSSRSRHLLPGMSTGQLFDPSQSPNYGFVVPEHPSRNLRAFLEYINALSQDPCDFDRLFNCFAENLVHRILPASLGRPVLTKRLYRDYLKFVLPMFGSFQVMSLSFYRRT